MSTHAYPETPLDDVTGLPGWIDLVTPDPSAAMDFYAGLLGWTFRSLTRGYVLALADDEPVAGLCRPLDGEPSRWNLYLTVQSTANTAERIRQLGGQVQVAPHHIPGLGDLVIGVDPSGATVGFHRPEHGLPLGPAGPGRFTWAELNTWDGEAADHFYRSLFPFDQQQIGDGEDVDYTTWYSHGTEVLGRLRMGQEFPPDQRPHWMVYLEVTADLGADGAAARVRTLGGRVLVEPFDGPYGRAAVLADLTGATFTVLDRSRAITVVPEEVIGAEVDDPYDD